MGLLDSVAGSLSAGGNPNGGWLGAIGGLIDNPQIGGLPGLLRLFEQGGLGNLAASWVGTGENLPVSGEQLQSVLGSERLQAIAAQLGVSTQDASSQLAGLLPQVVDRLTPGGRVPEGGADLGGLLGSLGGLLGGGRPG